MKIKLGFITIIIIFIIILPSCKKGKEDPFISFLSRKERICGNWKVTSGEVIYGDSTLEETDTFDADGVLDFETNQGGITGTYYWTFEINKNGTYTIYKNMHIPYNSTYTLNEQGYWYFLSKNKDAGIKNKEYIAFQPTTSTEDINTYQYKTGNPTLYDIVGLWNKKIILQGNRLYKETNPTSVITDETVNENITLTPDI